MTSLGVGMRRMLALVPVFAVMGVLLSGCSPEPEPEPTPEPTAAFASEEEAFAAAEETYRAYLESVLNVDFSDSASLEDVYAWLVEDAESSTRKSFSELTADDVTISGPTTFSRFEGISADLESGQIIAAVCLDVSAVDVVDSAGQSLVSESRPDLQPLDVTFVPAPTPSSLAISTNQPSEGDVCAL